MFSLFKKNVIPHVRMTGVIGAVGRFKQGIELANQQAILKRLFHIKKQKQSLYLLTHQAALLFNPI